MTKAYNLEKIIKIGNKKTIKSISCKLFIVFYFLHLLFGNLRDKYGN